MYKLCWGQGWDLMSVFLRCVGMFVHECETGNIIVLNLCVRDGLCRVGVKLILIQECVSSGSSLEVIQRRHHCRPGCL